MKKTVLLLVLLILLIVISVLWFKYCLQTPTERQLLQMIYNEIKH